MSKAPEWLKGLADDLWNHDAVNHGLIERALLAVAARVERETIERCKAAIAAEKGPHKRTESHETQIGSWSHDECFDQIAALRLHYKEPKT